MTLAPFECNLAQYCKASLGWVIQGGSRSRKGKRGRKREGGGNAGKGRRCGRGHGHGRDGTDDAGAVPRGMIRNEYDDDTDETGSASTVASETKRYEKKGKRCPETERACDGSRGSNERSRGGRENTAGASTSESERLTALVGSTIVLRSVEEGKRAEGREHREKPTLITRV
jgi:hypothetical protein